MYPYIRACARVLMVVSALALCGQVSAASKPFTVVTTFTVIADMAKNVAGNDARVLSITKPGAEIHNYEPTPQDLIRAQQADLVLWNGLNLEVWFERFFSNVKNVPSVVVTAGVTPMSIRGGEYDGKPNPHAWMSVANARIYVDNIEAALVKHDPKHAAGYHSRAQAYREKLNALDGELRKRVERVPAEQRWLVTSEGAFSYLARDLGLREAYLWPINAEQQGTPQQVSALIETVRKNKIPVVFSESTVSDKPAKQVAKESGARYGGVLYVDSLSAANGPVPTFLDLLRVTTDTVMKGLEAK